jgi:hypothetical protein
LTRFIQDKSYPKPQILKIQNILHHINTVSKTNDEGKANANIVETYGHQGINAIIKNHIKMKLKRMEHLHQQLQ